MRVLRVSSVSDAAQQCLITDGDVTIALRVIEERGSAIGRVGRAGGVVLERSGPVGHVGIAGGVAIERLKTGGRVVVAGCTKENRDKKSFECFFIRQAFMPVFHR